MTTELLADLARRCNSGEDLSGPEATEAAAALASESVDPETKELFLLALHEKGESAGEVAALASFFRGEARNPGDGVRRLAARTIDVVGTGGDQSGAFNISTTVCCLLAASGVPVIKHGNHGATSASGSADLVAELGFPLEPNPSQMEAALQELNFTFCFAPAFHPAFKHVAPIRKALAAKGQRTVFNILGPLLNPALPAYQLLGVFAERWVEPLAEAMSELGVSRGLVVHGQTDRGVIDKLSCAGPCRVRGVGELRAIDGTWTASDYDLPPASAADLAGGSAAENQARFARILAGDEKDPIVPTLLFNAGAARYIAGHSESVRSGVADARATLADGSAARWLKRAREFHQANSSN